MGLPVRFRNVHYYRIAGKYIFGGDLFIARRALYFFPESDLEQQRHELGAYLPENLAIVAVAVIYLAQNLGGAYQSRVDFWKEGLADQEFQMKARTYIDRLRAERATRGFSQTLPVPSFFVVNEISNMRLSWSGKLTCAAQSDLHDFNIGPRRKNRLRNALWEAGLWAKSEQ